MTERGFSRWAAVVGLVLGIVGSPVTGAQAASTDFALTATGPSQWDANRKATFTFTVQNRKGSDASASVRICIGNTASFRWDEGSDPDGTAPDVYPISGGPASNPTNGQTKTVTATIRAKGTFTAQTNVNFRVIMGTCEPGAQNSNIVAAPLSGTTTAMTVSLSASPSSWLGACNTAITLSAAVQGGSGDTTYKFFWVKNPSGPSGDSGSFSSSSTWTWTPQWTGQYTLKVTARRGGQEATREMSPANNRPYVVAFPTYTLNVNPTSGITTSTTLTASVTPPTSCIHSQDTLSYKFLVNRQLPTGSWTGYNTIADWGTATSKTYRATADGLHAIQARASIRSSTGAILTEGAKVVQVQVGGGTTTDPPYGWVTQVTANNAGNLAVTTLLTGSSSSTCVSGGSTTAEDTIAGQTIRLIVTDANTKVRSDKCACQQCHRTGGQMPSWNAANLSKTDFCGKVDSFNGAGKPQILKDLFNGWKTRNCPD